MTLYGSAVQDSKEDSLSLSYKTYERLRQNESLSQLASVISRPESLSDESELDYDEKNVERSRTLPLSRGSNHVVEASSGRKAVVMVACLYLHACTMGLVYALGVIYVDLIPTFNTSRSQAALMQTMYCGISYAGGVFMSVPISKYGPVKCVIVASIVATISLTLSFFATNIETLIISIGLITGLSMSVLLLSGYTVISQIFVSNKKVALSVLTFASTIGQVTIPNITNALLNSYNWNGTFLILGAVLPLNCVPCGLILWSSERYMSSKIEFKTKEKQTWRHCSCLTDVAFVLFIITTFLLAFFGPVESWFVVDLAVMKGFSRESGASLLSFNGIFGFIGRLFGATILKLFLNTTPDLHIGYSFLLIGVGHILVLYATQYWAMVLAIGIRGLSTGIVYAIFQSMQIDLRGSESLTETVAICNMVLGIASVLSGYIGGLTVDITGNYNLIFYMATAASGYCGISMAIIYFVRKRRQKYDEQSVSYQAL